MKDYIKETAEGVEITLLSPASINGVMVDKILMREPTGRDYETHANIPGTDAHREFLMFASLIECSPDDVRALKSRNLIRVQNGFKVFTD